MTLPEALDMVRLFCVELIIGVYNVPFVEIPFDAVVIFTSSNLFGAVVPMPTLTDLF